MRNKTEKQQEKAIQLVSNLLSGDNAKHLLDNLTDMYIVYNQSNQADSTEERRSKSGTFLILTDFLGGLNTLK